MRIFISGAMTGHHDFNRTAFHDKALWLRMKGHEVFNPAELEAGHEHRWYMDRCIDALKQCDVLYQLKGWEDSEGARMEYNEAISREMEIWRET